MLAGEQNRGACAWVINKTEEKTEEQQAKYHWGSDVPEGCSKGNSRTVLRKVSYLCAHGPEDHRRQPGTLPPKKQRRSAKASGVSNKVCVACGMGVTI